MPDMKGLQHPMSLNKNKSRNKTLKNQRSKKMKNLKNTALFLVLVILTSCSKPSGENAENQNHERIVPVRIKEVVEKPLASVIESQGRLSASKETQLSFKYAGIIDRILVNEGQEVMRGQVLATLDLEEINAQLNQVKASYEKAARDLQRMKNLYSENVITLENLQNSETAFEMAKSELEIIEFNKRFSTITAPSKGQILAVKAEENELVNPGRAVFDFANTEDSWVMKVGLVDKEIVRIEEGDSATIIFDAFPAYPVRAEVSLIPNAPNSLNDTYDVELSLTEFNAKLKSGFYGKVNIYPSSMETYRLLPLQALVEGKGREGYVFIPGADGKSVVKEKIFVEEFIGDMLAISATDKQITRVVVEGASDLRENTRIEIIQ